MIGLIAALLAVVTAPYTPVSYACDGSTATFTINFPYQSSSDLVVTSTTAAGVATTLAITTDFTTNVSSTQSTASLSLLSPGTKCAAGSTLKIARGTALTQPTGFRQQTVFSPSTHETALDRLEMQTQEAVSTIANPVLPSVLANSTTITGRGGTTALQLQDWFNMVANVKTFGATGNGSTDDSGFIQLAINSFGAAPACGTVYFPRGTYAIGTMIDVNNREGCVFVGAGQGQATSSCTTTLKWTGAAGGTVLRVFSTRWSEFQDFCVDGNGLAGIDIDLTALNATAPSQEDHFKRILITGVSPTTGSMQGIHVGSATNDQISEVSFDGITCLAAPTCFFIEGSQTKNISISNGLISHPTSIGIDIEGGELLTHHVDFQNNTGGTIDVKVAGSAAVAKVTFIDNYHEDIGSNTITAYSFPVGIGTRVEPSTFIGGRVLYTSTTGGTVIDYQQQGPVGIFGTVFTGNAPAQGGTVSFNGPGASPNRVHLSGVAFYNSNVLSCAGLSTCIYDSGGSVLSATTSEQYRNAGIDMWGTSLNFSTNTGATPFKIRQNSTQFQFLDSSNNLLGAFVADAATVTGTWSVSKLRASTGISADSGGFKHLRTTTGCTTAATAGAVCNTTITWTTAFANSAYTVACTGAGAASGVPVIGAITSRIAASINIQTVAVTAVAAQFTTIECIAVHD